MPDTHEANEDVLRKIRKLLALADSPNHNEAAAAAAKARRMLLEHGLSMDQLGAAPEDVQEETWRNYTGPRLNTSTAGLAKAVATANMCDLLVARRPGEGGRYVLVGRPAAIKVARAVLDYLYEAMERDAERRGSGRGAAWKNDYRRGWIYSVAKRFEETKRLDDVQERALVLREDQAVVQHMAKYKDRKVGASREMDSEALVAGLRDGQRVSLAKQVASASTPA